MINIRYSFTTIRSLVLLALLIVALYVPFFAATALAAATTTSTWETFTHPRDSYSVKYPSSDTLGMPDPAGSFRLRRLGFVGSLEFQKSPDWAEIFTYGGSMHEAAQALKNSNAANRINFSTTSISLSGKKALFVQWEDRLFRSTKKNTGYLVQLEPTKTFYLLGPQEFIDSFKVISKGKSVPKHKGYLEQKEVKKLVSKSGNSLTITAYDNVPDFFDNCEGYAINAGVRTSIAVPDPRDVSCEVVIQTRSKKYTFTNFEMRKLGGMPFAWANDITVSVGTNYSTGYGSSTLGSAGLYDVKTGKYAEALTFEQPGYMWNRALIESQGKRFLLLGITNGYNLYELKSKKALSELFVRDVDQNTPLIESLNPGVIAELKLIGSMALPQGVTDFEINIDGKKNILFSFGTYSEHPKRYAFNVASNSITAVKLPSKK